VPRSKKLRGGFRLRLTGPERKGIHYNGARQGGAGLSTAV
jgi:hypothetical protein